MTQKQGNKLSGNLAHVKRKTENRFGGGEGEGDGGGHAGSSLSSLFDWKVSEGRRQYRMGKVSGAAQTLFRQNPEQTRPNKI